jgi:hypothetical protein
MNTTKRKPPSLETKIGLYWLHRLGVASLVFGIVFLITYSIQLCGNPFLEALLKLGSGLVVSALLLFLGARMSGKDNQKWFAHGLTAGGWSLAYFTTYAAHYLPDLRVIDSLPVETLLLSLVAAGSLWSALRARSELMAIYSITLASVTILMNGVGLFSDISFLIIAITAAVLGSMQSWRRLLGYGLACCYGGNCFCSIFHSSGTVNGTIATSFLTLIWFTFAAGIGLLVSSANKGKSPTTSRSLQTQYLQSEETVISEFDKPKETSRNSLTTLACTNAALFATSLALLNQPALVSLHESLFVLAGVLYLIASRWMQFQNEKQLYTVHSLLGLFLINAAKSMHFSGLTLLTVDVLQIGLLAFVGLKYNINPFKWVAAILSALFSPLWICDVHSWVADSAFGFAAPSHVMVGLFAAAVMGVVSFFYARANSYGYMYFYHLAANVLLCLTFQQIVEPNWQVVAYALLAVTNIVVGTIRNSAYYAIVGLVTLIGIIAMSVFSLSSWLALPMALTTAILLAGHMIGRMFVEGEGLEAMNRPGWLMLHVQSEKKTDCVEAAHWLLAYVGVISLTMLVLLKVPNDYVSLALGIEGLGLLAAGFVLKEQFFRLSSLIVLAVLTLKLLFVDLANHDTIERILSFIAAGVIFLLSSFAYGKFTRSFEDDDTDESFESEQEPVGMLTSEVATEQDLPLARKSVMPQYK